ncbi:MAG: hypothetical protein MJ153_02015 [Clostridia bacterium]|nr:hypothetical protein [Clostridia bacterium]
MQLFTYIDYTDMLEELNNDLEQEFITGDSVLYIIRQNTPVTLPSSPEVIYPVMDYFYSEPKLNTSLETMSIDEAKKLCYSLLDKLDSQTASAQIIEVIIKSLSDYTKGKSKRNSEPVLIVKTTETDLPFTFYFDSDDASDELETITVNALIEELSTCNQH